ncbi:hypothetical protein [Clostridium thermosuccinogenes]|uniref:hypothetical protein n=1 Tax=Clostridium thermosuccinogenes TaxID=84032 RepID=UPI001374EB53|nr:hypothetical protein [Pseudoclostridium thermosuccinogenes]
MYRPDAKIVSKTGWCSILVGTAGSEDGPKNPFKGTSMKFLVSACYAQWWADAGS